MRKRISLGVITLLLLISGCSFSNNVKVRKKVFKYNYGEKIHHNNKTFLKGKKNYVRDAKIDYSNLQEDDYGNVKAGKYALDVETNGEKDVIDIKVVDTKKPVIDTNIEYEIEKGSSEKDLINSIYAYDQVGNVKIPLRVTIINRAKLNLNKVGVYNLEVEAKDKNGNMIKKRIHVRVIEKQETLVCRQTQDVGEVTMDYRYNVIHNRIVSETIIVHLKRDNAMYYYLATDDKIKQQFESSLKDYLGLDQSDNLKFNYQYNQENVNVSVDISQEQLKKIYGIDFKTIQYSKVKKDLNKSKIHICEEEK